VHGDAEKAKAQALTLSYWDSRIEGPHYLWQVISKRISTPPYSDCDDEWSASSSCFGSGTIRVPLLDFVSEFCKSCIVLIPAPWWKRSVWSCNLSMDKS
jgi:hypothetical protein